MHSHTAISRLQSVAEEATRIKPIQASRASTCTARGVGVEVGSAERGGGAAEIHVVPFQSGLTGRVEWGGCVSRSERAALALAPSVRWECARACVLPACARARVRVQSRSSQPASQPASRQTSVRGDARACTHALQSIDCDRSRRKQHESNRFKHRERVRARPAAWG